MSGRRKAPPHAEASESWVYAGRTAVGLIIDNHAGRLTAIDVDGKGLGTFKTPREAMRAVIAAARGAKALARG